MNMIYRHQQPAFFYRRPPSSAHPVSFLGFFLKNMFFLATAWFAASIAIRMVVLTLSIVFSPPVFVLLLLTFATSWWSFDALRRDEQSSFSTTATRSSTAAPFGGRCGQSPCSRGARQRHREFCHRFQQQCQSKCQQKQSCQKRDNETKPASSTTEDSGSEESTNKTTERLNNFQQPKQQSVVFERAPFRIEQDDQQVTLSIDVPGYSARDLNITVDQDGTLAIAGERKNKIGDAFAFQRKFVLSLKTMNTTTVTADVVNGLLIVTFAKKAIPKPRLIAITTGAQETDRDEDDQHVTLSIDVPGYSASDLGITVDQDGTLAIAGERKNKIGDAFSFQRKFVLSLKAMDTNTIAASVVDGLLTITIAKKEIPKPRLIAIATEAQETDRDEADQHVTLSIDAPGYSARDLNITVDQDGTLAIVGERKSKIGDAFSFQRKFVLSLKTMDTNTIAANVVDGLLIIAIAKKEIPKPRLIAVSTEAQEETDRDEAEGPPSNEEGVEEETIVFESSPVEEGLLLSTKKPIAVETVNDENEDDEIEESDPVEGDHDSWEDVIKE